MMKPKLMLDHEVLQQLLSTTWPFIMRLRTPKSQPQTLGVRAKMGDIASLSGERNQRDRPQPTLLWECRSHEIGNVKVNDSAWLWSFEEIDLWADDDEPETEEQGIMRIFWAQVDIEKIGWVDQKQILRTGIDVRNKAEKARLSVVKGGVPASVLRLLICEAPSPWISWSLLTKNAWKRARSCHALFHSSFFALLSSESELHQRGLFVMAQVRIRRICSIWNWFSYDIKPVFPAHDRFPAPFFEPDDFNILFTIFTLFSMANTLKN